MPFLRRVKGAALGRFVAVGLCLACLTACCLLPPERPIAADLAVQRAPSVVWGVDFAPDSETLASGGSDELVKVWKRTSPKRLSVLRGHQHKVLAVKFSPDGKLLASASQDGTVRLWDTKTDRALHVLRASRETSRALAFSPDSKLVACGGDEGSTRLWCLPSGAAAGIWKGRARIIYGLAFSPRGRFLAIAGLEPDGKPEGVLEVWDVRNGKRVADYSGGNCPVAAVAFSPDGTLLLRAGLDGRLVFWDRRTHRARLAITDRAGPINAASFTRDGRFVLAALDKWQGSAQVDIWDSATGRLVRQLRANGTSVTSLAVSPDNKWIAASTDSGQVALWRTTMLPPRR